MAATYEDIQHWLERGKKEGATHVIIACDTFSWTDYPVFIQPFTQVEAVVTKLNEHSMQRVMEVYNLSLPLEPQLQERRAWHTEKF